MFGSKIDRRVGEASDSLPAARTVIEKLRVQQETRWKNEQQEASCPRKNAQDEVSCATGNAWSSGPSSTASEILPSPGGSTDEEAAFFGEAARGENKQTPTRSFHTPTTQHHAAWWGCGNSSWCSTEDPHRLLASAVSSIIAVLMQAGVILSAKKIEEGPRWVLVQFDFVLLEKLFAVLFEKNDLRQPRPRRTRNGETPPLDGGVGVASVNVYLLAAVLAAGDAAGDEATSELAGDKIDLPILSPASSDVARRATAELGDKIESVPARDLLVFHRVPHEAEEDHDHVAGAEPRRRTASSGDNGPQATEDPGYARMQSSEGQESAAPTASPGRPVELPPTSRAPLFSPQQLRLAHALQQGFLALFQNPYVIIGNGGYRKFLRTWNKVSFTMPWMSMVFHVDCKTT